MDQLNIGTRGPLEMAMDMDLFKDALKDARYIYNRPPERRYGLPDNFKVTAQMDPLSGLAKIRTPYGVTAFDPSILSQGDCSGSVNTAMASMLTDEIARKVKDQQEQAVLSQLLPVINDYARKHCTLEMDMHMLKRLVWREEPMFTRSDCGCPCCPVCGTHLPSKYTEDGRHINCCPHCGQVLMFDGDEIEMNRIVAEYNECVERIADTM